MEFLHLGRDGEGGLERHHRALRSFRATRPWWPRSSSPRARSCRSTTTKANRSPTSSRARSSSRSAAATSWSAKDRSCAFLQRAAPRRGARRHARSRHLQPHPRRLAQEGRRLPAGLNWRSAITHFIVGAGLALPCAEFAALRPVLPRWAVPVTAGLFAVAPDLDTWAMMALDIPRGSLFQPPRIFSFAVLPRAAGTGGCVAGRPRPRALPVGSRVGRCGDHAPAPRHAYRRRLRRDAVFPVLHRALLLSLAADPRLPSALPASSTAPARYSGRSCPSAPPRHS